MLALKEKETFQLQKKLVAVSLFKYSTISICSNIIELHIENKDHINSSE